GRRQEAPPLRPRPRDSEVPLSWAQERIWFLDRLLPGNPALNMPSAVRLAGMLDAAALRRCLAMIADRHEALRTNIATVDGRPVQMIRERADVALPLVDLGGLPAGRREGEAARLGAAEAERPFDLGSDLLLRTVLLRLDASCHVLLSTLHHVVADGWSV